MIIKEVLVTQLQKHPDQVIKAESDEDLDTGGIPTDFLSNGFKCRMTVVHISMILDTSILHGFCRTTKHNSV